MGPVRMISSGHELTTDYDEKTLHELGFKDMQVKSHTHTHYSSVWNTSTCHISLSIHLAISLSLFLSICLSTSICLSLCVCLCLGLSLSDGVCVSGCSSEGEEGRGCTTPSLLLASSSEGTHPHAVAPAGAAPHYTVRPARDARLLQSSRSRAIRAHAAHHPGNKNTHTQ